MKIDIGYYIDNGFSKLSNFTERHFIFQGIECKSLEGFLQSIKFKDFKKQKEICKKVGYEAKKQGFTDSWKKDYVFYWKGNKYGRHSQSYQRLLDLVYMSVYKQDKSFGQLLDKTNNSEIIHSIGNTDSNKTILTNDEFCSRLMKLRDNKGIL